MTTRAVLAALFLSACYPPTPAHVFRVEHGSSFRHCQITFGWWLQDMINACGEPDALVADAGNPSAACALYKTQARTFITGSGADTIVACMAENTRHANDATPLRSAVTITGFTGTAPATLRVTEVYGMALGTSLDAGASDPRGVTEH